MILYLSEGRLYEEKELDTKKIEQIKKNLDIYRVTSQNWDITLYHCDTKDFMYLARYLIKIMTKSLELNAIRLNTLFLFLILCFSFVIMFNTWNTKDSEIATQSQKQSITNTRINTRTQTGNITNLTWSTNLFNNQK